LLPSPQEKVTTTASAADSSFIIMSDLCGSSENLMSIVNYTLRKVDEDDNVVCPTDAPKQITMSKDSSSPLPSTPDSRQEKDTDDDDDTKQDGEKGSADQDGTDKDAANDTEESDENNKNEAETIAPVSDLSDVNRRIYVVTTAGLPWRYVEGIRNGLDDFVLS
jgi:hypothetical protein